MGTVIDHPAATLMREVEAEQATTATPEAIALVARIYQSISEYWKYLDRNRLIYDEKLELMKASGLHITFDEMNCEIVLKDGPIDRRYNGGEDPDPWRRGLNPT
jgi:hypothetical protein